MLCYYFINRVGVRSEELRGFDVKTFLFFPLKILTILPDTFGTYRRTWGTPGKTRNVIPFAQR